MCGCVCASHAEAGTGSSPTMGAECVNGRPPLPARARKAAAVPAAAQQPRTATARESGGGRGQQRRHDAGSDAAGRTQPPMAHGEERRGGARAHSVKISVSVSAFIMSSFSSGDFSMYSSSSWPGSYSSISTLAAAERRCEQRVRACKRGWRARMRPWVAPGAPSRACEGHAPHSHATLRHGHALLLVDREVHLFGADGIATTTRLLRLGAAATHLRQSTSDTPTGEPPIRRDEAESRVAAAAGGGPRGDERGPKEPCCVRPKATCGERVEQNLSLTHGMVVSH